MTLPVSFCPVTAGAVAVGFGTLIPTGGFGEPCRWPGEVVGADVEGRALGVAVGRPAVGVGVGFGVRVGDGSAGTGEMADRVGGAADETVPVEVADCAGAVGAAADDPGAEPAAAELTAAELAGRSAGFDEVLQAASAEKAVIAMMILVRRAVRIRRAIPHAATPGYWSEPARASRA